MKVKIKTAHGYLSFQPDGRLEYRAKAGPWEEIDVEGLEPIYATLFPKMVTPQPSEPPPVPTGSPTASYVADVKATLQQQGVNLSGACGAFEITKRVAWGLRGLGYGLLDKPGGNNCNGYATDIVMKNDGSGTIVDILGDGGNGNTPNWSVSAAGEVDPARWRPAVQP